MELRASMPKKSQHELNLLREEVERLRAQLEESQETLAAIQSGAVDALVINTPEGERVFSLEGSEHAYRALIEQMSEGAVTVHAEGTVHYCNRRFAELLKRPLEVVIGGRMEEWIAPEYRATLASMLAKGSGRKEMALLTADGEAVPVQVSAVALREGPAGICLVVTDLTERKGQEARILQLNEELERRVAQRTAQLEAANQELAREAAERQRAAARYSALFSNKINGMAHCRIITDEQGRPVDYWIVQINEAYERIIGINKEDVEGRRVTEVFPDIRKYAFDYIGVYGKVALEGGEIQFEEFFEGTQQYLSIYAFSPVPGEFAAIFTDVTERKRAEQELKAARLSAERSKEAAEAANQAKDHFLAVLSHELRNPLNPVLATAAMLREDPRFDADIREQLEVIWRNAELEARLIEDLLDVTRIERGKIDLDRQPFDLPTIIRRAAEVCMPDIEARAMKFSVDVSEGPYYVAADAARLQQVFWNLLKNAVKFTPVGGSVRVRCRRDGEGFVVTEVTDSGVGIEAVALERIFNAFEQAERSIMRQFGGLGLGLTISKALVEMHGGTIRAHSDGKGKGATFTVRLPLLQPQAVAELTPTVDAAPRAKAARPLRILLVEDHGDTARIMQRMLTANGHKVAIAADVCTALRLAGGQAFDLMLSDLGLPDGSGLELMRTLRAQGSGLPAIALSGYGQETDIQQSREAGFSAHLVKPVNLPKLEATIASVAGIQDEAGTRSSSGQ